MSSNPSFPYPSRHRRFLPYRVCIECGWQFTPEVSTQMMCRLCQVHSVYSAKAAKTATCAECKREFTMQPGSNNVKFCGDDCRSTARLRSRLAAAARYQRPPEWSQPDGGKPCEVCGRGFEPARPNQATCNSACHHQRRLRLNRESGAKRREALGR